MFGRRRLARERVRRGAVGALVLTLGVVAIGVAAEALDSPGGLPLGSSKLKETRVDRVLGPGVKLTRISRGVKDGNGGWAKADNSKIQTTDKGPWRVRVLTIDPRYATGSLQSTYGQNLGTVETTTTMANAARAVAGTNGGFFDITNEPSSRGNPVGLAIHDGVVESEPTSYEPERHFVLDASTNTARVTKLKWKGAIKHLASGTAVAIDHVNEPPVVPEGCGLRKALGECDQQGEVSVFTPDWGGSTPIGAGVEAILDSAGCLISSTNVRGVVLGRGQISVQATGLEAVALTDLVALGCVKRIDNLTDPDGEKVAITPSTFAVNGRYQLLDGGKVVAPVGPDAFFARNPRTIAGTAADGRIILITIDGRSRTSVGATLREAAQVAKSLGVTDALNLDGGGSTVMSITGHASNKPSDGRERSVGDALVYVPAAWRPEGLTARR